MSLACPHKCLNVLGNEIRIKIILLLKQKPRTVRELCEKTGKEQSLISHSLKQLRECSFVDYKKKRKERKYFIKSRILIEKADKNIFEMVEEHAKEYCEGKK